MAQYLKNRDYLIKTQNYRKKCGEIDVVAEKDGVLHFVEVKAGSWKGNWPDEGSEHYSPADHMHEHKRKRLARVIEMYLGDRCGTTDIDWTCDLAVVLINKDTRRARVTIVEDVLL